jgi:type IV secretory pathway TraG/TraD family ATPase VirD4
LSTGKHPQESNDLYQVLENLIKLIGICFIIGGLVSFRCIKNNPNLIKNRDVKTYLLVFASLILSSVLLLVIFYYYHCNLKLLIFPILSGWIFSSALVYVLAPIWLKAFNDSHITVKDLDHGKLDFKPLEKLINNPNEVPIGISIKTYKPYTLLMENRTEHLLVSGATGQGKTSLMITLLKHAFIHNQGVIIIDPKGELLDVNIIKNLAKSCGKKEEDFLLFSLADVNLSCSYNILGIGTPEQKKSKIKIGLGLDHEHYGDIAAQAIGTYIDILDYLGIEITVKKLRDLFVDKMEKGNLAKLVHGIKNESDSRLFLSKLELINDKKKEDLSGVIAKLDNLCAREFMPILGSPCPLKNEINLLDVIKNQKIAYFQMNTNGYADISTRVGKLIIQDLKLISSLIQSGQAERSTVFTGVFVDEFGSFAMPDFADFLKQVRSANIGLHLFFQGSADLRNVSEVFEEQVLGNTIVKIIFRQDVNSDVEKWAHMAGTEDTMIHSYQTTNISTMSTRTGTGNVHEGKRMKIDFDIFKNLTRGKAVVIDKGRRTHDVIAVWNGKGN